MMDKLKRINISWSFFLIKCTSALAVIAAFKLLSLVIVYYISAEAAPNQATECEKILSNKLFTEDKTPILDIDGFYTSFHC